MLFIDMSTITCSVVITLNQVNIVLLHKLKIYRSNVKWSNAVSQVIALTLGFPSAACSRGVNSNVTTNLDFGIMFYSPLARQD